MKETEGGMVCAEETSRVFYKIGWREVNIQQDWPANNKLFENVLSVSDVVYKYSIYSIIYTIL
jgi:hypothetical protein